MVPAKMPDEPFGLKSLYVSGAIPNLPNLEACMVACHGRRKAKEATKAIEKLAVDCDLCAKKSVEAKEGRQGVDDGDVWQ
ncbi:hypothetical protein E4U22_001627 [Claviceps purpurea]|nr:hypothetical protein E4U22_001627 [Claviceps purpurea]